MELTKLWIMLNQLNTQTKTFEGELSPLRRPRVKILEAMVRIYADATLREIDSEQVSFLKSVLQNVYKFNKGYDFQDKYWFETTTDEELADRAEIKNLIIHAHDEAVISL
jgi:hypothetical protein